MSDIVGGEMSDKSSLSNMRDRIAEVLDDHITGEPDEPCGCTTHEIADAVIEALGLRRETTYAWSRGRTMPTGVRYVSKWQGVSPGSGDTQ